MLSMTKETIIRLEIAHKWHNTWTFEKLPKLIKTNLSTVIIKYLKNETLLYVSGKIENEKNSNQIYKKYLNSKEYKLEVTMIMFPRPQLNRIFSYHMFHEIISKDIIEQGLLMEMCFKNPEFWPHDYYSIKDFNIDNGILNMVFNLKNF